ncbi:hypothetical protein AB3Y40_05990 [Yoonia sp. R2331]|uniref:hypothetical protein n=1 Tax=Yoonia sp. R2331 TaxID=3237238 RepID=UPI0034E51BD9
MTSTTDPPRVKHAQVHRRFAEYREMFREIRRMMAFYGTHTSRKEVLTGQVVKRKLNELQRLQALLLKAEEALYDQIKNAETDEPIDLETIRDQIGRRLDRLRATLGAKAVSEDPDAS